MDSAVQGAGGIFCGDISTWGNLNGIMVESFLEYLAPVVAGMENKENKEKGSTIRGSEKGSLIIGSGQTQKVPLSRF